MASLVRHTLEVCTYFGVYGKKEYRAMLFNKTWGSGLKSTGLGGRGGKKCLQKKGLERRGFTVT